MILTDMNGDILNVGDLAICPGENKPVMTIERLKAMHEDLGSFFTVNLASGKEEFRGAKEIVKLKGYSEADVKRLAYSGRVTDMEQTTDLFGRTLKAGDLVVYGVKKDRHEYALAYGAILSNTRILEYPNYNWKQSKLVYKIENPSGHALQVLNALATEYNQTKQRKLEAASLKKQPTLGTVQVGDIFRNLNDIYVYIGRYRYELLEDKRDVYYKLKTAVPVIDKEVDLYFHIDMTKAKSGFLYQEMSRGMCSVLERASRETHSADDITYFTYTEVGQRVGKHIGHISYWQKDQYLSFYNYTKCHRFTKL